jgi:hypothetical protein
VAIDVEPLRAVRVLCHVRDCGGKQVGDLMAELGVNSLETLLGSLDNSTSSSREHKTQETNGTTPIQSSLLRSTQMLLVRGRGSERVGRVSEEEREAACGNSRLSCQYGLALKRYM